MHVEEGHDIPLREEGRNRHSPRKKGQNLPREERSKTPITEAPATGEPERTGIHQPGVWHAGCRMGVGKEVAGAGAGAAEPTGHAARAGLLGASCSSQWPSVTAFVPGAARDKRAPAGEGHIADSHRMSHLHLSHQNLDLPPKPPLLSVPGTTDWAPQQAWQRWWHPKKA